MKTVLVTGASAGFGEAICRRLIADGYQVIGAARRADKLTALQAELGARFFAVVMDVTDQASIDQAFQTIFGRFPTLDILVNNAGLALVTHQVLPRMVAANSGLIINIGSVAGTVPYPGGNVYGATKAFVKQFSLNLRADLAGSKVRVSNIEPGLCSGTDFSLVRLDGNAEAVAALYQDVEAIRPEDIANTVAWISQLPEHMNINSIEIMPVAQSYAALNVTRNL
ncbi:SDR family NAD(P)-dependent oxidoreductase [Pseudomonas sp.]|uniref:SDR family NAD(P)-dependent oxidoreductase n=1 Tax=Pseudomonas sp. TaxID=306 RepID=UPI0027372D41|nr:SDR family NAD(P)-dependent oxidoreductase [Pseudomonas sp.]MDP3817063.1 SDR family NAD(P)-dependent oxidoreductase [Pseudomonas sp.]